MRYALFIGRWQPFHNGHKHIIDRALDSGKNVCIAMRDTPISESDPYSFAERRAMVERVYGDRVRTILIPDIESVNVGRNVGYEVNYMDSPREIEEISGTRIREGRDDSLPPEVARYIGLMRSTTLLTGLPCSGKTTLAQSLARRLGQHGYERIHHLDGDDFRGSFNDRLDFTEDGRRENLLRAAHVCRYLNSRNNVVLASFVSPLKENRDMMRGIIGNLKIVYVKCDVEICEGRDIRGMWRKARKGEIGDFTGVSARYEEPDDAEVTVDTGRLDIGDCVDRIIEKIVI